MSIASKIIGGLVDVGVRLVKRALKSAPPEPLAPRIYELESERVAREAAEARRIRMERERGR